MKQWRALYGVLSVICGSSDVVSLPVALLPGICHTSRASCAPVDVCTAHTPVLALNLDRTTEHKRLCQEEPFPL